MGTIYGYARVSTVGQGKGNSLEEQQSELIRSGADPKNIFVDKFTGTSMERPEFDKLISKLKRGDTLIVTKLDRFGRSASKASLLITDLLDKGITINVLQVGILSNDSVNTLLRNVLLSFAQFERDMIVQRTQEGKAIAKQKPDFREGRPPIDKTKMDGAMSLLDSGNSYKQVASITGVSVSSLTRYRRKQREQMEQQ